VDEEELDAGLKGKGQRRIEGKIYVVVIGKER
jgi:hypothetical protein